MKQHEREYFISRIRSGNYLLKHNNLRLNVLTPTISDEFEANEIFINSMTSSFKLGIKNQDEMLEWMKERNLWTDEDQQKTEGLNKDIERLKMEVFNYRNQENQREKIRKYIRAGEKQLTEHTSKKYRYHDSTSEGIAFLEKSIFLISRCTFINDSLYSFDEVSAKDVWMTYQNLMCDEKKIRELAREDPWRTMWLLKDTGCVNLFLNNDRELSVDQKNLLAWSNMYDSISQSPDNPSDDVVNDDDMLDGWLIIQRKKREKDRAQAEVDSTLSDKTRNAGEIFLMAGSQNDVNRIDSMNDTNTKMIKQERNVAIRKTGGKMDQHELPDQKLLIQNQLSQQYKDKFRR